jgi:hypothetical protein
VFGNNILQTIFQNVNDEKIVTVKEKLLNLEKLPNLPTECQCLTDVGMCLSWCYCLLTVLGEHIVFKWTGYEETVERYLPKDLFWQVHKEAHQK